MTIHCYINKDIIYFNHFSLSAHGRTEISANLYTLPPLPSRVSARACVCVRAGGAVGQVNIRTSTA